MLPKATSFNKTRPCKTQKKKMRRNKEIRLLLSTLWVIIYRVVMKAKVSSRFGNHIREVQARSYPSSCVWHYLKSSIQNPLQTTSVILSHSLTSPTPLSPLPRLFLTSPSPLSPPPPPSPLVHTLQRQPHYFHAIIISYVPEN